MNIKKLKVPKRMKVTSLGSSKLRGMKVVTSFKSIKKMNVAKKFRSLRKRSSNTGGDGGGSRMGIRRNSTKLIAMVKKNIMKPKFRHLTNKPSTGKRNNKNIIIIHNNTSITSNDEDNRSSCVEVKEIASLKEEEEEDEEEEEEEEEEKDEDVTSIDSAPPTSFDSLLPPPNDDHSSSADEDEEEYDEERDLREEKASIHIQCVFRGHLARRAFKALKGLVKLQAVVRGVCVRRQARMALHCMNTLARLQVKVRARQLRSRPSHAVAASS